MPALQGNSGALPNLGSHNCPLWDSNSLLPMQHACMTCLEAVMWAFTWAIHMAELEVSHGSSARSWASRLPTQAEAHLCCPCTRRLGSWRSAGHTKPGFETAPSC